MSLVRVWTDIGSRKPVPLLAKIIEENGVIFTIRYLSESDDKIWRYEEDTYEIDNESIAEYLKTDDEQDVGFRPVDDGFVKIDSDDDYVPSSSEELSEEETDEEFTESSDVEEELSESDDEEEYEEYE
jgi:hypothetical protein